MGSSFKNSNSHSHGHSQRGNKPYALMLLLAFGAAILGVMVLHKLREKRIFTLLVREKDHELLTLHLLFQREKEFNQEARKKIEEMKNKVYSLRTQKLELDRRLLEMESTISSLKDERKVIESTLEEKKNKIQLLTAGMNSSSGDAPQVTALKDLIKMKDAEIEDLKLQLEKRDVQSEGTKLITSSTSVGTRYESENDGDSQLSSDSFSDSTSSENRSQNGKIIQRANEHTTNIEPDNLNDVKDGVDLKREYSKNEEKETADFQADPDTKVTEDKAKASTSHENEQQKLQENQATDGSKYTSFRRGGLKLEKPDGSVNGIGSRVRRKHSKGRRRETLRNRRLGDDMYSVSKTESTPALTSYEEQKFEINQAEKTESEFKKEPSPKDQLPLSDKLNQTTETRNDGQSIKEEAGKIGKERGTKSTEIKSNRTEETGLGISVSKNENAKTKLLTDGVSDKINDVKKNARKQISDEISHQLHDQDENRKNEKLHSIEAKNHENDDEQGNEIVIEDNEAEDSEDAETHEPEIDRDDIRRFSESDPDEEAEETEF